MDCCYNCGNGGHIFHDCIVPKGLCYGCGESGHTVRKCIKFVTISPTP